MSAKPKGRSMSDFLVGPADSAPTALPQREPETMPKPAPDPVLTPARKRGRPRSSPTNSYARVSAHVDEATYKRVAMACLDQGIDRQEFLVRAIDAYLDKQR